MALLLALGAALSYGTGDFLGGMATRRGGRSVPVVLSAQVLGGIGVVAAALVVAGEPGARDLWWGGFSGVAGALALTLFYRALASGVMSLVAPVTAVVGAVVPIGAGLLDGERPSNVAMAGIVVGLAAVALIGLPERGAGSGVGSLTSLVIAAGAGIGFGLFFVGLDRTSQEAGLWPIVAARGAAVPVLLAVAAATRAGVRLPRRAWTATAGAGLFDTASNVLFLLATRRGLLAVVGVITSLYPVSTIALAHLFLHERLSRPQLTGLGLAGASLVLVGVA